MSRGWLSVRVLLMVALLVGGPGVRASAAPRLLPPAASISVAPPALGSTPDGSAFKVAPGTLSELPSFTYSGPPTLDAQQVTQAMDRLEPLLQDLAAALDAGQFDLDALGAQLGYAASSILAFVRTQVVFEQYLGVLRGDLGTLLGRAGNAFDQALLLRRLLDDAGYETRLARTTLTEAQARALVAQMARPRAAAPPIADLARLGEIQAGLQAATGTAPSATPGTPPADKYAVASQLAAGDAALVLDGLKHAGISLGSAGTMNNLVQEARDYLWVQYRLGSYDPWIDAHPAFADPGAAPKGLAVQAYYRDALPNDLYHRIRLSISVEQKVGDTLSVTPLIANWERKATDLVGHPVTLQQQPDNLDLDTFTGLATLLREASLFVPFLDGTMADQGFDLLGSTYNVSLLSTGAIGAARLGQLSDAALQRAAAALGGDATAGDPNYVTLTAEWIDYTLVAPGGKETTTRRYLLDRVGEANRRQGIATITDATPLPELAKSLLASYTILVLPGEYTPAAASHRVLERIQAESALRPYLQPGLKFSDLPQELLQQLIPIEDTVLSAAFSNGISPESGIVAYRAEPTLAIYERGMVPGQGEGTAYERVDVIRNARRVFSTQSGTLAPAPEAAVAIGAWETHAERSLLRSLETPFGALSAIREAAAAGISLRVLKPGDTAVLQGLAHSDATKAGVQRDLDAGYVVILPERAAQPGARTGWWRVNPATGETLGIGTGGYGTALAEYAFRLSQLYSAIFFVGGMMDCTQHTADTACCVIQNLVYGAMGFGAGMLIGGFAGLAIRSAARVWLVSFLLGDVGLGVGGMLFLPDRCAVK